MKFYFIFFLLLHWWKRICNLSIFIHKIHRNGNWNLLDTWVDKNMLNIMKRNFIDRNYFKKYIISMWKVKFRVRFNNDFGSFPKKIEIERVWLHFKYLLHIKGKVFNEMSNLLCITCRNFYRIGGVWVNLLAVVLDVKCLVTGC